MGRKILLRFLPPFPWWVVAEVNGCKDGVRGVWMEFVGEVVVVAVVVLGTGLVVFGGR